MTILSAEFVATALGITGSHTADNPVFTEVCTDSRRVTPGCLFVALRGERFDAHDFIGKAIADGATGVICERGRNPSTTRPISFFACDDTLLALRQLARAWRTTFSIPIIAIAGSVGKTTTKDLLAAILRGRWPNVLHTEASQNGFLGIPLTLMRLRPTHQVAVIEVGIDAPGAMQQHMELMRPTAAMLTAIGPEHLEQLIDLATVTKEERLCLQVTAKQGGQVIINVSDPAIAPLAQELSAAKPWCFGMQLSETPDSRTLSGRWSEATSTLSVRGLADNEESFVAPLPGEHNASNLLGALTVAQALGLSAEQMRTGLATCTISYGRSEIHELRGAIFICDYYNANPTSMLAAFKLLDQQHQQKSSAGKRWLVLGDMLELGNNEAKIHADLAASIQQGGYEHVLLYGPRMQHLAKALPNHAHIEHATTHAELSTILRQQLHPGDTVLIKGSRGMRMEEIWLQLKA